MHHPRNGDDADRLCWRTDENPVRTEEPNCCSEATGERKIRREKSMEQSSGVVVEIHRTGRLVSKCVGAREVGGLCGRGADQKPMVVHCYDRSAEEIASSRRIMNSP